MQRRFLLHAILLAALIQGCTTPQVGYDYDRSASFNRYHTYAWVSSGQEATGDRRLDSSLVDSRIRTAVNAQLRAKGYLASLDGRPDFFVTYRAGMKDMMKGAATQRYIGDRAHGTFTTVSDIQPYNEGTLVIDVVDANTQQLVWQAFVKAELDQSLSPEQRDARVNAVVRAMLARFPPQ